MLEKLYDLYDAFQPAPAFAPRSSKWAKFRAEYLKVYKSCEACGRQEFCVPHHVIPFHIDPTKELDYDNLITLCESPARNCHLIFGHLLDWSSYNPDVRKDARLYLTKVRNRP